MDHHLREIADCLDEVLRLQSRVMDLSEQVSEAAGMNPGRPYPSREGDRALFRRLGVSGGGQSPSQRHRLTGAQV